MTPTGRSPVALGLLCLATGCLHDSPPPPPYARRIPCASVAVALDGVAGPTVATRVRAVRSRPSRRAARPEGVGSSGRSEGFVVERTDVHGLTVTYLGPGRRAAYACERAGNGSTTSQTVVWSRHREARAGAANARSGWTPSAVTRTASRSHSRGSDLVAPRRIVHIAATTRSIRSCAACRCARRRRSTSRRLGRRSRSASTLRTGDGFATTSWRQLSG